MADVFDSVTPQSTQQPTAQPTQSAPGLITPGNINLANRPAIPNPDGGMSTVYSTSFEENGKEILVPRAADGKILSEDQARARYHHTGEHLGIFDSPEHATAYAQQLHNDYAAGKYGPASGDVFDQITPGGSSQAPSQAQPEQPSLLSRAASVGTGLMKGASDTVTGLDSLVNKIPIVGEYLAPKRGIQNMEQLNQSQNTGESVGKFAENVAEFFMGDEALKSLSLGEKMLKAGKLASYYEKAGPTAKAVINHMLSSARQGVTAGVEQTVKSGDVGQGVETGAEAAAGSAVVGAVGKGVSSVAGKLWNSVGFQKALQAGIHEAVGAAADDAGVEAGSPSIRKTVGSLADAVKEKSKGLFQTIDDATDGEFTNVQNKLKNVGQKLREIAGTDDDAEEKLFNQQTALHVKLDEAIEAAKKAGVEPEVAEQARDSWKQMSALEDLDTQVKLSTSGNVKNAPETVDPQKLANRLQKLEDSGRLSEALGDENANKLLQHAYDAVDAAKTQKTAATWGKRAAVGAGLAGGGSVLGHVLSGGNH